MTKEEFMTKLYETKMIRFGEFRLRLHDTNPNAPLSPFFINLRSIRSYPDMLKSITYMLLNISDIRSIDLIADVPTSATPIATTLSLFTNIPMISPRKEKKTTGISNVIDGDFKEGQKVLLIDDVITWSDSKIDAYNKLTDAGLEIEEIIVLVDRMQGGIDQLKKIGVNCKAVMNIKEIMNFYINKGLLDPLKASDVLEYIVLNKKE